MPKASLLTDDQRDQLLKEMAFGIPISELSVKYNLKPIQIEYQRGNNSKLYNMYVDFFCIKDEILDWETGDTFRFVLNLLYGKVKPCGYHRYLYKGKTYSAYELIPEANKVLAREELPLIDINKPVRIRYTTKRSADQQIDKSDMPDIIRKLNLYYDEANPDDTMKIDLINGLLNSKKRVNWKTDIQSFSGDDNLPALRVWYRLWSEGNHVPRGGKVSDMNHLLKFLSKHDLLQNNYFNIKKNKTGKTFGHLELKPGVTKDLKFEFNGFKYIKQIESFINTFCLGLQLDCLELCLELALNTGKKIDKSIKTTFKKELNKFCEMLDEMSLDDDYLKDLTCEKIHEIVSGGENG